MKKMEENRTRPFFKRMEEKDGRVINHGYLEEQVF